MTRQTTKKEYHAALYCRLSRDDGKYIIESSSIQTQKEMLSQYAKEHDIRYTTFYVDYGYTGTNFDRPDFKRMINDIEAGKINMVITKDLSRLGREYIWTGIYTEIFFPEHQVRYVALNDTVDTMDRKSLDFAPIKNFMNEFYAKDTSEKVKSALFAKLMSGKCIYTTAPYGYMKSPDDRYKLIIDERYAPNVRLIFEKALEGKGISQIRKEINEMHILRPAAVNVIGGYERFFDGEDDPNRYTWSNNSIRGILHNPAYAGHLYTGKRPQVSFKCKKRLSVLPEDYTIIPNVHEPIVSQEDFDVVQKLIKSRRQNPRKEGKIDNIFAGLIKCADCGYAMTLVSARTTTKEDSWCNYSYSCNNYKSFGNKVCTRHWIVARDLYDAVLNDIRKHAKKAIENDEKLAERLLKKVDNNKATKTKELKKQLKTFNTRLAEIDKLFIKLYEDYNAGNISERNFRMMSKNYEEEQASLERQIAEAENVINDTDDNTEQNADQFAKLIKQYAGIKELDVTLLNTLIDKITVGERHEVDGETVQEIKIYYKFIGYIG